MAWVRLSAGPRVDLRQLLDRVEVNSPSAFVGTVGEFGSIDAFVKELVPNEEDHEKDIADLTTVADLITSVADRERRFLEGESPMEVQVQTVLRRKEMKRVDVAQDVGE